MATRVKVDPRTRHRPGRARAGEHGPQASRLLRKGSVYLALLPAVVLLVVFEWYPAFSALANSLYSWNGGSVHKFIGLQNYIELFHDTTFLQSARNGAFFVGFRMVIQLVLPFIAAELIAHLRSTRFANFWKVLFIAPLVVPGLAMMLVWRFIYQPQIGLLNMFLQAIGLKEWAHAWLSEPSTALAALSLVQFPWLATLQFLILLGGLQAIPKEVLESSVLDGAGTLARIRHIEIPYIAPQIAIVLVFTAINMVQQFALFLVLTDGGPGNATLVPGLYLYHTAFTFLRFGYASAIGVLLFLVLLLLAIVSLRLGRQRTQDL